MRAIQRDHVTRMLLQPDAARQAVHRVLGDAGCRGIEVTAMQMGPQRLDVTVRATGPKRQRIVRGIQLTLAANVATVESWCDDIVRELELKK